MPPRNSYPDGYIENLQIPVPDMNPVARVHIESSDVEVVAPEFAGFTVVTVNQNGGNPGLNVALINRRLKRMEARLFIPPFPVAASFSVGSAPAGVTAPTAGQTIISLAVQPGTYNINWTTTLDGTLSALDRDNFQLFANGVAIARSANDDLPGTFAQAMQTNVVITAASNVNIVSPGAGTATATYLANIEMIPVGGDGNVTALVLNAVPDSLNGNNPQGLIITQGGINFAYYGQRPIYAIAIGGPINVGVLDQSFGG